MAEDDLRFGIQARGWTSITVLPAEVKDLLWAQERAADLLPYQLPGARRPSLGTVYVRQDVGSGLDDAPAEQPSTPKLDEHGQLVESPSAPAAVRVAARPPSKPMQAALDNDDHLVITGGPGQGKSTLTLQLTADIVRAWSAQGDGDAIIAEPVLPLRLPARVLAAHLGQSISQTLAGSASAEYGRYLSGPLDSAVFARRVDGCRWLLLIDALDEIADSDARAEIVHTLAAWAAKDPYRVLLTTRPAEGGTLGPLQRAGAVRYELLPFDDDGLRRFSEHWFRDEDLTHRFLLQVREAHLFELVTVPLLATIAAIVFEQHGERPLPGNQFQLYESYLAFIRSSRAVPEAFERHCTALVEHLGRTRLRSDIPLTTAIREWARCNQDAGTEEDIVAHLTAIGPFIPRGGDLTFLHHSFAEHVAATADARDLPEEFDPVHPVVAGLLHRAKPLEEGRFARAVLLHYTHLNTGQADELLRWLHGGTSDDHLLAARLLARHLPAGALLIDEFLATVRGWAMTTQYQAGQILASVSRATHHPGLADWLIELLRDESAPWASRAEAATAVAGRLRDPRAAEAIEFLRWAVDDVSASVEHRLIAAEALADSGSVERDAAERGLRSVLADPLASGSDNRVAAVVLAAFGGEARADAVAALERIVSDPDTSVGDICEAATGLAEIGVEFHDRCKEIFLAVLRDSARGFGGRRTAVIGLASLGASQLAAETVADIVADRRMGVNLRAIAAMVLERLGPAQRAKAANLVPKLFDFRFATRRAYPVHLIRLCPQDVAVGLLRRIFNDVGVQWGHVVAAADALAELGPAFHEEAASQLRRVLDHTAPSRFEFVSCLRGLGNLGEPHRGEAIVRMRTCLADLRLTPDVRCSVAQALIGLAPEYHAEAAFHLLKIARSERSPGIASKAWQQLHQLGPELSALASKELLALAQNDVIDGTQLFDLGILFSSADAKDRCATAEVLIRVLGDTGRSVRARLQAVQSLVLLGGPFERAAAEGALDLLRSGAIHDLQYLAGMFSSAGRRVRASLIEAFYEILVDELTGPSRAWTAMDALDVLGHEVPAQILRAYVADPSADLDDRACAAVMLARMDRVYLPEAVALVFRACPDVGLGGWRGLVGDLVALGVDVRPRLRELAENPDRRHDEVTAAAGLLGTGGLPMLRRRVEDHYLDFKSRLLAYQLMVETDPSVRTEAIEAYLAMLHDPDAKMNERCDAAVALTGLNRSLSSAMSEVLWRFAEDVHYGVAERALAAEALHKVDGSAEPRLNCVIGALARHPEMTGERAAKLARLLPRESRTEVEGFLLADRTLVITERAPRRDNWDDRPLGDEAEAAVRDVLFAPEFTAAERRQAAVALSRLSAPINPEALALLFADGTSAALALAAREGAWTRVHDQAREVVLDDARPIRERRSAALLIGKISAEPSVRDFLLEDRNAPGRVRVDELRYARAFDELRAVRDSTGVPAAQRRQAVGHLMKLSLDDRAACARVLTEIAADQTVPAALRWRAAGDLTNLGPAGRAEGVRLLEALVHDDRLPVTARSKAAAVVNATVPTKRVDMLAVMRGLLPKAKPLQRVGVLLDIGAWWVREAVAELGAMAADTGWGPVVRLRAARNLLALTRDQRGLCALVAREVATDPSAPGHVRRAAASRLARWSDECREEARALLRDLRCD